MGEFYSTDIVMLIGVLVKGYVAALFWPLVIVNGIGIIINYYRMEGSPNTIFDVMPGFKVQFLVALFVLLAYVLLVYGMFLAAANY
jgi:hypothetical protein